MTHSDIVYHTNDLLIHGDIKLTQSAQTEAQGSSASGYAESVAIYQEDLDKVEKAIQENFQSDVTLIPAISSYLASGGGKRIRPLLLIVSSRLCGYKGSERHINLSVVMEYVHAATLLHDDVVDDAVIRRGSESANIKFGNQASVLVGDFLFAKSLELMSQDKDIRVIKKVSMATKNLAEGEVLQLTNTGDIAITEQIYLDTIYRKTGALIEACLSTGAVLGNASKADQGALEQYGRNIGLAFQLVDDALDYTADSDKWGKPVGADLAEGRVTMPLIQALKIASADEKKIIEKIIDSDNVSDEDFETTLTLLKKYDSITYTFDLARKYIDTAKLHLAGFKDSTHLDTLHCIADYIIERNV